MVAGDTMVGRRIPVVEDGKLPAAFWEDGRPGDYCGPIIGYTGDLPAVFFLKPNARDEDAPRRARSVQHVTSPPHRFEEMPDGSLQIRESIAAYPASHSGDPDFDDGWHGYLDAGHVWREV